MCFPSFSITLSTEIGGTWRNAVLAYESLSRCDPREGVLTPGASRVAVSAVRGAIFLFSKERSGSLGRSRLCRQASLPIGRRGRVSTFRGAWGVAGRAGKQARVRFYKVGISEPLRVWRIYLPWMAPSSLVKILGRGGFITIILGVALFIMTDPCLTLWVVGPSESISLITSSLVLSSQPVQSSKRIPVCRPSLKNLIPSWWFRISMTSPHTSLAIVLINSLFPFLGSPTMMRVLVGS